MKNGAIFSDCGRYRYLLVRCWSYKPREDCKIIAWIMLNPSTADEVRNDPTIRRCISFSKTWGFDGMYVLNLFGFRTPNPRLLKIHHPDQQYPIGYENDDLILKYSSKSNKVIVAWGNHGELLHRGTEVLELLNGIPLFCLGVTERGNPKHPLYIKGDTQIRSFPNG